MNPSLTYGTICNRTLVSIFDLSVTVEFDTPVGSILVVRTTDPSVSKVIESLGK